MTGVQTCALPISRFQIAWQSAANSRHFVWLYSVASLVVWAPAVVWVLAQPHGSYGVAQWLALGGTAVLHLLYSLTLQVGYRVADLSLVYPIARGTGPLLSFVGAALLFHERPGPPAAAGLLLIVAGIVLIADLHHALRRSALPGLMWGSLTGAFIAAYTLNDGWAVKILGLSPFLIDFSGNCFRVLALSHLALNDRGELAHEWRSYRRPVLIVATLGPLGYLLVLWAMQLGSIAEAAALREISVILVVLFGIHYLKEPFGRPRLLACGLVMIGILVMKF